MCKPKPKDANRDGTKDDTICLFYIRDAGFQCGDTVGVLKGMTKDGIPIEGRDSVTIKPCE